ncbi:ABC transporter ATP-binding protein [Billgrantia endophytica]|uniref:Glycerol-3-phosphate ABC transporter ATP-binding protein n=1 Tax=Billgrantia endophytica TaxID=2033802 RepID=A0A2N7TXB3_9GAMM|nr:ABC transporter ATP-binding protein [Halomonas endophytica]PMR72837.1 glycerol-3-phosphate ABC transporter ATP-binding protein [Halomonas endophytica]
MAQSVKLSGITKTYAAHTVLNDVSLDIQPGEFLTLVGASGCGKSTLLRIIAGLEEADRGTISIGERDVSHLDPQKRDVAMVFQSYALYPHMTVGENIATPLRMSRLSTCARWPLVGMATPGRREALASIGKDVRAVATQLQIEALLGRKPAQLSGGQRQRVALARAMVRRPAAFLMDEPLSNLDAKLRVHMRTELTELHRQLGATFIYVTHDQVEAMTMSDRIALMADGNILQLGTPDELYHRPASLRVAQFIGSPTINCLEAIVTNGVVQLIGVPVANLHEAEHRSVTVAVRPEALRLHAEPGDVTLQATAHRLEHHGADCFLLAMQHDQERMLHARLSPAEASGVAIDQPIRLHFRPAGAHFFAADGLRIEPPFDESAAQAITQRQVGMSA